MKKVYLIIAIILWGILAEITSPGHSFYYLSFFLYLPFLISLYIFKDSWIKITFAFGLIYNIIYYRWLIHPFQYTNVPFPLSLLFLFLMAFALTMFLMVFSFFIVKIFKFNKPFSSASLFVCLEIIKGFIFTGFPWGDLSYNFYSNFHLIQIANISGSYSISFIIILINLLLFQFIFFKKKSYFTYTVLIVSGFLIINSFLLKHNNYNTGIKKNILIVQGNVPESMKLKEENAEKILDIYMNLTKKYILKKGTPDLIVWPESVYIKFMEEDEKLFQKLIRFQKELHTSLIFGMPSIDVDKKGHYKIYNSLYVLTRNGVLLRYDKIHLVPFGEYTPLKRILFFVNKIVPGEDFSKGLKEKIISFEKFKIVPLICFEGIFPLQILKANKLGGNVIINISNEAWFGKTYALYQHLAANVLRTVENGKFFIRCANTGISAVISPEGKILKKLSPFTKSSIYSTVILLNNLSFYDKYGYLINFLYLFILNYGLLRKKE